MDWERVVQYYRIRFIIMDLAGGRGFAIKTNNGYTVLLDHKLSWERRREIAIHEMAHIVLGHCESDHAIADDEKLEQEVEAFLRGKQPTTKHREYHEPPLRISS